VIQCRCQRVSAALETDVKHALELAACLVVVAACGSPAPLQSFTCEPRCPAGLSCTSTGCAPGGPLDLGAAAPVDLARTCDPACGGETPYCKDDAVCVPCLEDSQCPAGQRCQPIGRVTACVAGCGDASRCPADAPACCGGGCVDTTASLEHCGACGAACRPAHATGACVASQCTAPTCEAGWGDCNGLAGDGCEVHLLTDAVHCGACGTRCGLPHATAGCDGACYIAACAFGFDDCDGDAASGCEQPVLDDPRNCGACGHACPPAAHARVGCRNASCGLESCGAGFLDCDGSPQDGCEVNGASDVANCGACGNACGQGMVCRGSQCTCPQCNIPNASSRCESNQCTLDRCNPGYGNCDGIVKNGCEVDLGKDRSNCGACGVSCAVNQSCFQGACADCWPRPDGAVAFWTGDGNAKELLAGDDGVEGMGVTYGPGLVGQAFQFDGTGGVAAPAGGLPTGGDDRTLELWARQDVVPAAEAVFASWGPPGVFAGTYGVYLERLAASFSQWGDAIHGPDFVVGTWTHIAVTTEVGLSTLYVNGQAVASGRLKVDTVPGSSMLLGYIDASRATTGAVDEVTVYNRALSAQELLDIYNAGALGKCR